MPRILRLIMAGLLVSSLPAMADGLLVPNDEDYPKDFMHNRVTRVTVQIHGLVVETVVYQEFVNEWHRTTDAVYAFPLPPEARATSFLYWHNDTLYQAVLQVKEQAPNPGTGEGGIIAEVNRYIGNNGIKVQLRNIAPDAIQRVELHYLSVCDYFVGRCSYRFPLNAGTFVKHPLDLLEFDVSASSNTAITNVALPSHTGFNMTQPDERTVKLLYSASKEYPATDVEFFYEVAQSNLGVDFYSVASPTGGGHYALFVRPQVRADSAMVLPKRVIFLLGNSSRMVGFKLEQSIAAITQALAFLTPQDAFNLILFNSQIVPWQNALLPATVANVEAAITFLNSVRAQFGSRLDLGLQAALAQFPDDAKSNAILVFTDGRSPLDPREIAVQNHLHTGVFAIGTGDDIDRARLEMTAALNHGFVTYFNESDNLSAGMLRVFQQINQPILKNVGIEVGQAQVYDVLPQTLPATYAGSYFSTTGRYRNSGNSAMAIAGEGINGTTAFDFVLNFSSDTTSQRFAANLWAKEMIDALEREISVYGETPALKDSMIALSLRYNIRCRYTAYVADYETLPTSVVAESDRSTLPSSYLIGNYPNPFNPVTTIAFYLSPRAAHTPVKLLKIYDALGRLVAVIDLSAFGPGSHVVRFDGRDFFGNLLPTGVYFARLQVGSEVSTIRMILMK